MVTRWLRIILLAAVLVSQAGCGKDLPEPDAPSPRVVTFSPAITDMMFAMGLGDHIVGVTTQDILPAGVTRRSVGSPMSIDAEAILAANPDVILTQVRAEAFETVRKLKPGVRIEHFRVETLAHVAEAAVRIGKIVGKGEAAGKAARAFGDKLQDIRRRYVGKGHPRVIFVDGYERPVVPGAGTFIDEMISLGGGLNAGRPAGPHKRWRNVDVEEILAAEPDVLICLVSPGQEDAARGYWLALDQLPAAKARRIHVVSERWWTIPSFRMADLAGRLAEMIHAPADGGDAE